MNGTIDSVSREAAGWDIVDDKTDVDVTVAVLSKRHGDWCSTSSGYSRTDGAGSRHSVPVEWWHGYERSGGHSEMVSATAALAAGRFAPALYAWRPDDN